MFPEAVVDHLPQFVREKFPVQADRFNQFGVLVAAAGVQTVELDLKQIRDVNKLVLLGERFFGTIDRKLIPIVRENYEYLGTLGYFSYVTDLRAYMPDQRPIVYREWHYKRYGYEGGAFDEEDTYRYNLKHLVTAIDQTKKLAESFVPGVTCKITRAGHGEYTSDELAVALEEASRLEIKPWPHF